VIDGEGGSASRVLATHPGGGGGGVGGWSRTLAFATRRDGAGSREFFHKGNRSLLLQGDTARTWRPPHSSVTARVMVKKGPRLDARNRRGAEPLHYAAEPTGGVPGQATPSHTGIRGRPRERESATGATPLNRAVRPDTAMACEPCWTRRDVHAKTRNGSRRSS